MVDVDVDKIVRWADALQRAQDAKRIVMGLGAELNDAKAHLAAVEADAERLAAEIGISLVGMPSSGSRATGRSVKKPRKMQVKVADYAARLGVAPSVVAGAIGRGFIGPEAIDADNRLIPEVADDHVRRFARPDSVIRRALDALDAPVANGDARPDAGAGEDASWPELEAALKLLEERGIAVTEDEYGFVVAGKHFHPHALIKHADGLRKPLFTAGSTRRVA